MAVNERLLLSECLEGKLTEDDIAIDISMCSKKLRSPFFFFLCRYIDVSKSSCMPPSLEVFALLTSCLATFMFKQQVKKVVELSGRGRSVEEDRSQWLDGSVHRYV